MPGRSQTRSQKRGITSRNNEESQNLPPSKRYKVDPPPAPEVGAKTSSRKKKPTERRNYQETKATEDQLRKLQLEVARLKKKNGRQDIIIDTQRRERDRYYDAYYEANGHSPCDAQC
ncbi:hypothetical protein E1B28_000297 [Marasmius oreades]|uniref:Uncharacterized protein n=1 Tax=Marasmius oreades TaxID=181124 RepID=A0A9P8ADZ2_9AGAR|nr:uncharacterized protein E1B28_000297 [Marasmius oreades]KAG7098336.1 hypothetical protein E1B28_000297 [Marasmius oreades]